MEADTPTASRGFHTSLAGRGVAAAKAEAAAVGVGWVQVRTPLPSSASPSVPTPPHVIGCNGGRCVPAALSRYEK